MTMPWSEPLLPFPSQRLPTKSKIKIFLLNSRSDFSFFKFSVILSSLFYFIFFTESYSLRVWNKENHLSDCTEGNCVSYVQCIMIIDGFNFIHISLFIKSRFGGVFTLTKSYCSCFSIFISFSIWKVLAGYFYFERLQSNYCFKFSFKQREFPKFFTFRARDGVSALNNLHLQSWHVISKETMTESALPFSFRKIVFTGIWSQLWPFSWSSTEWGTLT